MPYTLSDSDIKSLLALCEKLHAEGKTAKQTKVMEFLRRQVQARKAKEELERLRKDKEKAEAFKRSIRETIEKAEAKRREAREAEIQLTAREVRGKTARKQVAKFVLAILKGRREVKALKEAEKAKLAEAVAKAVPAPKLEPEPKKEGAEAKPPAPKREITYTGLNWLKEPQYLEKVAETIRLAKWTPLGADMMETELTWSTITDFAEHPKYTKDEDEKTERYFNQLKPKIKDDLQVPVYNVRGERTYNPERKGVGMMTISEDGDFYMEIPKKMYEDRFSSPGDEKKPGASFGKTAYPAYQHFLWFRIEYLKDRIREARK